MDRVRGGLAADYRVVRGVLHWPGDRPGAGWHAHDWLERGVRVFDGERLVEHRVRRQRWRKVGTTVTQLSRCPDERGDLAFSAVVITLTLWAWLAGERGVLHMAPVHQSLLLRPSARTAQRWLARALPGSAWSEQALRATILEVGCEPWPAERLFPGGLPPPEGLRRRRWADPEGVSRLYRGLLWLVGGAVRMNHTIPFLLAKARGRWTDPTKHSLI